MFTDKTDTFFKLLIRNKKYMSPAIVQYILFSTRVSKYMSEMSGEIESQKGVYIRVLKNGPKCPERNKRLYLPL